MASEVAALRQKLKVLKAGQKALEGRVRGLAARLAKLEHKQPVKTPTEMAKLTERWSKQQRRIEAAGR